MKYNGRFSCGILKKCWELGEKFCLSMPNMKKEEGYRKWNKTVGMEKACLEN